MTTQNSYRFGFLELDKGDELNSQDYRFTRGDRVLLDQLLRQAIEAHEHTAEPPVNAAVAPVLGLVPGGGAFPAHSTFNYRVALVDDKGQESTPSPITSVTTPNPLPAPVAPDIVGVTGVGALPPGDYVYQISAFDPSTAYETLPSPPVARSLSSAGTFTLTFPTPPGGASGWNVYRKGPYDQEPHFLKSVPVAQASYVDASGSGNALRSAPTTNTTVSTTAITVDVAGGLPAGSSCKIYRTASLSDWSRSLVTRTGTLPFTDTNVATQSGAPLARSVAFGGAPKINLTDLAEIRGTLPPAMAEGHELVTWMFPGVVVPRISAWWWFNEFDKAAVTSIRATLGAGSVPAATAVVVRVGVTRAAEWWPASESFNHLVGTATIPPGAASSGEVIPSAVGADVELAEGDGLGVKITQAGGGATPTDFDLSIVVTVVTRTGSTISHVWS